ncbi:acyl-CoA dehydratase activase [Methanococcus aeolicus]|uniref:acyl-CoA dehydratase activase n=1 Tax=Methanococcus aeolicus TaxID=42879 RepID=UPI0021C6F86E|nr:acyl-CoA dehydratase activase [Methanococcus aeolicus]UXM84768.1 acyl-CoA dehydratase activase [Methanococcus aeolicus]
MIGVDVGSTNIKIYDGKKFKKYPIFKLNELLENYNNNEVIFATGYFRKKFKNNITEISAAIYGIGKKDVDIIVDIGGQDIKIIDTKTLEFTMNDKCGAGTGLFLQTIATYLNIDIEDFGKYYVEEPLILNNTCAVFSISEIINYLVNGHDIEEIIASVNHAIAKKVNDIIPFEYETMALIGGVAKNQSFVRYFRNISDKKIHVPENPQFINAMGVRTYGIKAERRTIN